MPVSGNSKDSPPDPLSVNAEIPVPDPEKPETQIVDIRLLVFRLAPGDTTAPAQPEASFGLPSS